jgi:hypothetical protein
LVGGLDSIYELSRVAGSGKSVDLNALFETSNQVSKNVWMKTPVAKPYKIGENKTILVIGGTVDNNRGNKYRNLQSP